jgi:hypothetical protein
MRPRQPAARGGAARGGAARVRTSCTLRVRTRGSRVVATASFAAIAASTSIAAIPAGRGGGEEKERGREEMGTTRVTR